MPVRLIVNPSLDARLTAAAETCMADGAASPEGLERCLREEYPRITVHNGVEVAGAQLWYVYREGHWIAE